MRLPAGWKPQIERIVGNFHVGTSDETIIADMQKRMALGKFTPAQCKAIEAYAIKAHNANRKLYGYVMRGR